MIACVSRIDLNVIFYRNRLLIRNLNGVFFNRLGRFDRFGRLLICGLQCFCLDVILRISL